VNGDGQRLPPTQNFPPSSRYFGVEVTALEREDGRQVIYLRRRFVPPPERFQVVEEYIVRAGERIDTIAARVIGDPEAYWRLCDANRAMRPEDLAGPPGRRLRVTLPEGIQGPTND
jgi:hypothetical protein